MDAALIWTAYAWAGWAISTAALVGLYWLTGLLGKEVFGRLSRAYHLTVIGYWLRRYEKEGRRTFQRPD